MDKSQRFNASEALRLARVSVSHDGYAPSPSCVLWDGPIAEFVGIHYAAFEGWTEPTRHRVGASLLLDGFSVEEITEAGG